MKLFISYSRDDKAWVDDLSRVLRKASHDILTDRRLVPADDWWATILSNIESCACFIYVMTMHSVESIYCDAELHYALSLNKPILSIMLKPCDTPSALSLRQIQPVEMNEDTNLETAPVKVTERLHEIEAGIAQNKYQALVAARPSLPIPEKKPEQISEVFTLAMDAMSENKFSLAEKLFQQVIDIDPKGRGLVAANQLAELQAQRSRNQEYLTIAQIAKIPVLRRRARAAASAYAEKYGTDYDPNKVLAMLLEPLPVPVPASPFLLPAQVSAQKQVSTVKVSVIEVSAQRQPSTLELLPGPFAWIGIPAGKATLVENSYDDSYIKKGEAQTSELAAFTIGKYPITNAQFAKFVEADGYGQQKWWKEEGWQIKGEKEWVEPRFWKNPQWNKPEYPVVGISWFEASAYCKWLSEVTGENIVIPTEQQWQRAAQGDTTLTYPWGDKLDKSYCNFDSKSTTPVQQYENKGDSPFHVTDMGGNVWEWCLTDFRHGIQNSDTLTDPRVLRGGSWTVFLESLLKTNRRFMEAPIARNTDIGFRVVRG